MVDSVSALAGKQQSHFRQPQCESFDWKHSWKHSVSKRRTAATNVSKLRVGDVLELTFPDDLTVWKAVVIENRSVWYGNMGPQETCTDPLIRGGTKAPERVLLTAWASYTSTCLLPRSRKVTPPSKKTVTKRSRLDTAPKAKKNRHICTRTYVRTHIHVYILPSGHPHTHVCLSCSIGCLIANFPTKIILSPDQFFRTRPEGFANK